MRAINKWNNLPGDVLESPLSWVFRMQLDRMIDNLIYAPFPMKSWTRWSFKVPSNLGCPTSVWITICPALFFSFTHSKSRVRSGSRMAHMLLWDFFFLLSVAVSIYFCSGGQVACVYVTYKLNLLWPFIHQAICLTTKFPSCCCQFFS